MLIVICFDFATKWKHLIDYHEGKEQRSNIVN